MIRNLAVFLLLLFAVGGALASEQKPKEAWLIGTWVLCNDPDQSPKDSLQFNPGGSGLVIRAKDNIEFVYKHSGQSVSLLANARGYAIPIELTASDTFDRLLLHSDKTGSTASYVRSDDPASKNCSVK